MPACFLPAQCRGFLLSTLPLPQYPQRRLALAPDRG